MFVLDAEFGQTGSTGAESTWQNCLFETGAIGCTFASGDGSGGTEANVGSAASAADCAAMVAREEPTANGATFPTTEIILDSTRWSSTLTGDQGLCYAEFGMTGSSASSGWQTCMLSNRAGPSPPPPPASDEGCDWMDGDGSGGTEEGLGDAPTALACTQLVMTTRPEANGATYQQSGQACFAEFGMTGHVASGAWRTCRLRTAPTVGCDFQEGDGTGEDGDETEEMVGETDTPVSHVGQKRPLAIYGC